MVLLDCLSNTCRPPYSLGDPLFLPTYWQLERIKSYTAISFYYLHEKWNYGIRLVVKDTKLVSKMYVNVAKSPRDLSYMTIIWLEIRVSLWDWIYFDRFKWVPFWIYLTATVGWITRMIWIEKQPATENCHTLPDSKNSYMKCLGNHFLQEVGPRDGERDRKSYVNAYRWRHWQQCILQ